MNKVIAPFDIPLSILRDIPEPDWQHFEIKMMSAIASDNNIVSKNIYPSFMALCSVLLCLIFWIALAIGVSEHIPTTYKIEPVQQYLSIQEQRIIKEFPGLQPLLTKSVGRYDGVNLEEYLKNRYPQLKGLF